MIEITDFAIQRQQQAIRAATSSTIGWVSVGAALLAAGVMRHVYRCLLIAADDAKRNRLTVSRVESIEQIGGVGEILAIDRSEQRRAFAIPLEQTPNRAQRN